MRVTFIEHDTPPSRTHGARNRQRCPFRAHHLARKRAILVAKQSNVDELFQKVGHHEKGAKWVAQQLASLAVLPG